MVIHNYRVVKCVCFKLVESPRSQIIKVTLNICRRHGNNVQEEFYTSPGFRVENQIHLKQISLYEKENIFKLCLVVMSHYTEGRYLFT